jgi:hypothetical protein
MMEAPFLANFHLGTDAAQHLATRAAVVSEERVLNFNLDI